MQRSALTEFLHGQMTSTSVISSIRDALNSGLEKHFEVLYYRKNGEYPIILLFFYKLKSYSSVQQYYFQS